MEIWTALQMELNRLYKMFTQRNPTFEANGGKVSIVSHSLGLKIWRLFEKYLKIWNIKIIWLWLWHMFQAVL